MNTHYVMEHEEQDVDALQLLEADEAEAGLAADDCTWTCTWTCSITSFQQ
ncbi:ALQxL family class IV lanthipeptide [Glycomyces xiaoerkulensis]|nr:ALQxL family class IV lanthipeptide [Glycomyces xiaoerkulensis]